MNDSTEKRECPKMPLKERNFERLADTLEQLVTVVEQQRDFSSNLDRLVSRTMTLIGNLMEEIKSREAALRADWRETTVAGLDTDEE